MTQKRCRKNERGAALVMVLLISFLLLVALSALILEASMNSANVTDATAEEQAYYAAESGIQSVIDALRHNPVPSPLVNPAASPTPPNPNADIINVIDYRKAVERRFSNATCDPTDITPPVNCTAVLDSAPTPPRMSRWIRYNWGPNGGPADPNPDRVVLGDPDTYSPDSGFAYSLAVTDPDDTTGTVTYTVSGGIEPAAAGPIAPSRTFTGPGGTTTITYVPPAGAQTVNVETGTGNGSIGRFTMATTGTGGTIPPLNYDPDTAGMTTPATFKLTLSFTQPRNMKVVLRGYISPAGTPLLSDAVPDPDVTCARTGVSYLFDSQNFINFGSRQTLRLYGDATPLGGGCIVEELPATGHNGPYGTYLNGWMIRADASVPLTMDITQPEPTRLLVRSTGFGPRGARKELESIVQKNYFDGLGAPSPLTLIGPTCQRSIFVNCTVVPTAFPVVAGSQPARDFVFEPGSSSVVVYSGKDQLLRVFQPPIGVTNDPNVSKVLDETDDFNGEVHGRVANIKDELPFWLQNPRNVDAVVQELKRAAQAKGTYWGPTSSPPTFGVYGDWATGTGITFVDRSVRFSGEGGGILVVNGQLELRGGYKFRGIMIVIGELGLYRSGGGGGPLGSGDGELAGNLIVAPYNNWSLATCMPNNISYPDKIDCFLPPRYEISGGGGSDTLGNSQVVGKGLNGLGNFVRGVAEK